jgi:hypothetical protein
MKQLIACFLLAADTRKTTPPFHNHIRKVCPLVAATLILPALAYAQNNQGNGGPGFNLGIPNGTYVFNITGFFPPAPGAFVAAVVRTTYTPNATGSGGTTSSVASYSIFGGQLYTGVTVKGTFTVNKDGRLSETYTQTSSPFQTLHFISYPTPGANTIAILQTDPGAVTSGVGTRGR